MPSTVRQLLGTGILVCYCLISSCPKEEELCSCWYRKLDGLACPSKEWLVDSFFELLTDNNDCGLLIITTVMLTALFTVWICAAWLCSDHFSKSECWNDQSNLFWAIIMVFFSAWLHNMSIYYNTASDKPNQICLRCLIIRSCFNPRPSV